MRAGIAASVYLRRLGLFAPAFDLLESRVLGVAERTSEAAPVLIHLKLIAEESRDSDLLRRFDALRSKRGA